MFHRPTVLLAMLTAVLGIAVPALTVRAEKSTEVQLSAHFLMVSVPPGLRRNAHQDYYLLATDQNRRYLGSSNVSRYVERQFGLTRPEFAVSADGQRLLFRHSPFFAGKRSNQTDGIYLVNQAGQSRRLDIGYEAGGVWIAWPRPLPSGVIPAFPSVPPHGNFQRSTRTLVNTEGDSYPPGLHDATGLEYLVIAGDLPAVRTQLSATGPTPASNYWGIPLLDLAMLQGHEDIALTLLEAGAAITKSSLATAATYRLERFLTALLGRREAFDPSGAVTNSALLVMMTRQVELDYSRLWGDASKAAALLDLTAVDIRIAAALIDAGAAIDARNEFGRTPFQLAVIRAANFNVDHQLLEELLRRGANLNAIDHEGNTALHFASSGIAEERDASFFSQGKAAQLLRFLLARGADVSRKNHAGETALQLAAQNNRLRTAELLVEYGADDHELFIYAGMGRKIENETIRQRIERVKKELWR